MPILMVIFLLTGRLQTMMKEAGLSVSAAADITAMFQIGGAIVAVIVGWSMDRMRPARVISAAYLAGGLCVLALGSSGALSPLLVFSVGFCMSSAQTVLNAYAASCYPTVARAAGVGWMLGMGRFGSILGSAIGGTLLGAGLGFGTILSLLAIPAVCAAAAILLTRRGSDAAAKVQSLPFRN